MGKITLTGERRIVNGIPVVRRMIVPKNKYSEYYKMHEENIKKKENYTLEKK